MLIAAYTAYPINRFLVVSISHFNSGEPLSVSLTFQNLERLKTILSSNEDALQELLQQIHLPLQRKKDDNADDRHFLLCPLNAVGDSHRSPWSNTFHPPLGGPSSSLDGSPPLLESLRQLEVAFNEVWDAYRHHYYGTEKAVGSVYVKEEAGTSFVACFLLQKAIQDEASLKLGQWDSVHWVRVGPLQNASATYQVFSSVRVSMAPAFQESDEKTRDDTHLTSCLTKETTESAKVAGDQSHLENIGKLIEKVEIDLRSSMDTLHFPKTREVVDSIRKEAKPKMTAPNPMMNHAAMLNQAVLGRKLKKPSS